MQGLLEIRWSTVILAEVFEHLTKNITRFDAAAGARLVAAMNGAFPAAEVEADSEADVLCTDNLEDFPPDAMGQVGMQLLSADVLVPPGGRVPRPNDHRTPPDDFAIPWRNRPLDHCCALSRRGIEQGRPCGEIGGLIQFHLA